MKRLELIGGVICLDFANTIDPRYKESRDEYLDSYRALVEWALHSGLLSSSDGADLIRVGERHPAQAERVRSRAVSLREAVYVLFAPGPPRGDRDDSLAVLNEELQRAFDHVLVVAVGDDYELRVGDHDELDCMLWPIAHSALELLQSPAQRARIKTCDGDGCGWLFVDTSKAGRRRWCSMNSCGGRAKGQRYRERRRGAER